MHRPADREPSQQGTEGHRVVDRARAIITSADRSVYKKDIKKRIVYRWEASPASRRLHSTGGGAESSQRMTTGKSIWVPGLRAGNFVSIIRAALQ